MGGWILFLTSLSAKTEVWLFLGSRFEVFPNGVLLVDFVGWFRFPFLAKTVVRFDKISLWNILEI